MTISSNHQEPQIVADEQALAAALGQRDGRGGAEFWLADGSDSYPCLVLIVSGTISHAIYFPDGTHPGFRCLRPEGEESLQGEGTTFVWMGCDPASGECVPNAFVVPFSTALTVAQEFFRSRSLPPSARWYEL